MDNSLVGEAQRDDARPLGWPYARLHGSAGFAKVWRKHFGSSIRLIDATSEEVSVPLMALRRLRPPSLSCRFDHLPRDRQFVKMREWRVLPLVQLSPPISLEAGNLRGGIRTSSQAPADLPAKVLEMLVRIGGWDVLQLPIPLDEAGKWFKAAIDTDLLPVVRKTGRQFYGMSNFRGWDALLASSSRNFRKNAARLDRTLQEAGATIRYFGRDTLDEGLAILLQCARASWKADETRDLPVRMSMTDAQSRFYSDLDRLDGHEVIISALFMDGQVAGAQSWVRTGDLLTAGLTFQNEKWKHLSPGHAQVQETYRRLDGTGLSSVDFNATAPWLAGYADVTAEFATLLATRRTLWGQALHRLAVSRDPGIEPIRTISQGRG